VPARRISLNKIKKLAEIYGDSNSPTVSGVAKSLRISRASVRRYRTYLVERGWSFTEFASLTSRKARAVLEDNHLAQSERYLNLLPLLPDIHMTLYEGKSDLKSCWEEYRHRYLEGYRYSSFVDHFRKWESQQKLPSIRCTPWRVVNVRDVDISELTKWRRSNDRRKWSKAVVILDSSAGVNMTALCAKLERSPRIIKRWLTSYNQKGIDGVRDREKRLRSHERVLQIKKKRDKIIEILHESPRLHGINRSSWSLGALASTYEKSVGEPMSKSTVSEYVRAERYSFRKARRVLTSPDPNYREKLQEITKILSNLREDEKFFSIDEFGPFSVKMQQGRSLVRKGTIRIVPQRQRSKGRITLIGALELSTNQMTHFYSEKKDTEEMIKLLDLLVHEYSDQARLYLSWDAASWHVSEKLSQRVSVINNLGNKFPMVKLAPLPSSAQFLNVIESVFSGLARAVIHNSDYKTVDECKEAIDIYFAERNAAYKKKPRRAGKKIWGAELVEPRFSPSNNCKDRNWR
jgi:transposase